MQIMPHHLVVNTRRRTETNSVVPYTSSSEAIEYLGVHLLGGQYASRKDVRELVLAVCLAPLLSSVYLHLFTGDGALYIQPGDRSVAVRRAHPDEDDFGLSPRVEEKVFLSCAQVQRPGKEAFLSLHS